jgi:hypothetical protein
MKSLKCGLGTSTEGFGRKLNPILSRDLIISLRNIPTFFCNGNMVFDHGDLTGDNP